MPLIKRADRLAWLTVALLAAACCILAVLQYRWISEFSEAERNRLASDLRGRLNLVAGAFNQQVSSALLNPDPSRTRIFRRVALVTHDKIGLSFSALDLQTGRFSPAAWPESWRSMKERIQARADHRPAPPLPAEMPPLVESHFFGEDRWLIAELNLDELRAFVLPDLLNRYLRSSGRLDYAWELVTGNIASPADASVDLLNDDFGLSNHDLGPPRRRGPDHGPEPPDRSGRGPGFERGFGPLPPPFDHARLRLVVRHHAGSLEAFVAQAKWRNLAASGGLLLLMLATVATLVRVTRQSQRLAAAQMDFVAGVSHELRTPLTVIRTAAFNLKRNLATRPEQIEQYGDLIQRHAERLTALVEQVLRFARSEAGHVIGETESVPVEQLIDAALESSLDPVERHGISIEKQVPPDLPLILADRLAMKHALQNLIENAIKYGTPWVGITALAVGAAVEIRVADRGPGIPEDEQRRIFDPFFRGRRAVSAQIHGAGLGLSLAKKIIEAHGGTIEVESQPLRGSEFIIRVPASPEELTHELAHSLG